MTDPRHNDIARTMRIGVLGAARVTTDALLIPARELAGVTVAAVAAREPERAVEYARTHGIPVVHRHYDELLADPDIDAVYVPTPAALHGRWTSAALAAGKHVLVEKPFAANAAEADALVRAAHAAPSSVVMEAYHTAHHPQQARVQALLADGAIGDVISATASFCVPVADHTDIRWNLALAGGGLMDVGYYPVRVLRDLLGGAPSVTHVAAEQFAGVDADVTADLDFDGIAGRVRSSIRPDTPTDVRLNIVGSRGRMDVRSPYHPQLSGAIDIYGPAGRRVEQVDTRSTYAYQLEAFRDAVAQGAAVRTDAQAGLAQMQSIDAIYRAAGMEPREPMR